MTENPAPALSPEIARSESRTFVGLLVVASAVTLALGLTLRTPSQLEVNDISRWCTVWSLLERGTYRIDDCPWQSRTQDKVKRPDKLAPPDASSGPLKRLEYALAPRSWKEGEATERFYSSKPPLLPTLIAGLLYPVRAAVGVPLDASVLQERLPRYVEKPADQSAGAGASSATVRVLETPDPVRWPVYVFYLKPIIILLNIVPMLVALILFGRLLDRYAENDWAWFLSLFAAAFATPLFTFNQTLNNHTVAASSAFFALYAIVRIHEQEQPRLGWYAAAGFWTAFCACNEIPAGLFGLIAFAALLARSPRATLLAFVPAALVPTIAFLVTQFLAFGQFMPVYEEFGTRSYNYEGSYWNTPLEFDYFNKYPEPYAVYLFHMTLGHHGLFSLTPLFLFSLYGAWRLARRPGALRLVAILTLALTVLMLAFYTWNPKARNYGGSTSGLRWLFWLIPFFLIALPEGVAAGQRRRSVRLLGLAALALSVMSVGYGLRTPWSHPWIVDMLEHLSLYTLHR